MLKYLTIPVTPFQQNCSLVWDDQTMDGTVIDPGGDVARIEAEIAFVMKAPLKGPGVTIFDVLNATDFITPSLEILDTRIVRANAANTRAVIDTISDNAANCGIVTGGRPVRPMDIDLRWVAGLRIMVSRNNRTR